MIRLALRNNKALLSLILLLEGITVGLLYLLNTTYGNLYSAIETVNATEIYRNIGIFSGLAMVLVVFNGYLVALANRLAFNIRMNLTHFFLARDQSSVPLFAQRIQEDTRKFSENAVELGLAVFKAGLKLPIFVGVMVSITSWKIGAIVLTLVVAGTWLTKFMASRLIELQSVQETYEARFREALGYDKRTLYVLATIGSLTINFTELNKRLKVLAFTQQGLGQAFVLVPFIVLMPLYVAKTIHMGAFFQAVNALGKVIDSLTVLIDSRQTIVNVQTSYSRIKELRQ